MAVFLGSNCVEPFGGYDPGAPSARLGEKEIAANGVYSATSDGLDGYSEVTVAVPVPSPRLQSKSITPSESQQTASPDSGYDGLSSVSIGAVSSTYVGSGVTRQATTTVAPTESEQTAVASGVYTTGAVKVGAISPTYVGSGVTKQAAKTVTPTTSEQTAVNSGVYTTGAVKVGAVPTETKSITENGTYTPTSGKFFSSVSVNVPQGGGGLQGVGDFRTGSCAKTTLTDVGLSVTAPATGTYTISWHCWRTNTSGTWGSRYYKGTTAQGTENTTWTNSYIQTNRITNVSLNVGDVIKVYARARSTSYTIYVGDLVLIQTA